MGKWRITCIHVMCSEGILMVNCLCCGHAFNAVRHCWVCPYCSIEATCEKCENIATRYWA